MPTRSQRQCAFHSTLYASGEPSPASNSSTYLFIDGVVFSISAPFPPQLFLYLSLHTHPPSCLRFFLLLALLLLYLRRRGGPGEEEEQRWTLKAFPHRPGRPRKARIEKGPCVGHAIRDWGGTLGSPSFFFSFFPFLSGPVLMEEPILSSFFSILPFFSSFSPTPLSRWGIFVLALWSMVS